MSFFVIDAERQYEEESRTEEGPGVLPQTIPRFAPASVCLDPYCHYPDSAAGDTHGHRRRLQDKRSSIGFNT